MLLRPPQAHFSLPRAEQDQGYRTLPAVALLRACRPGGMIHIDIKKLEHFKIPGHPITGWHTGPHRNCGVGWEYLHVCIDDYSRVTFSVVMPDQIV